MNEPSIENQLEQLDHDLTIIIKEYLYIYPSIKANPQNVSLHQKWETIQQKLKKIPITLFNITNKIYSQSKKYQNEIQNDNNQINIIENELTKINLKKSSIQSYKNASEELLNDTQSLKNQQILKNWSIFFSFILTAILCVLLKQRIVKSL